MKDTYNVQELEETLQGLRSVTSVWVPMGLFLSVKILLARRKESFSSLVNKAVKRELAKSPDWDGTVSFEEITRELRSFKKDKTLLDAMDRLRLTLTEVYPEEEDRDKFSKKEKENLVELNSEKKLSRAKEAIVMARSKKDAYYMETIRQLVGRLDQIEKNQRELGEKLGK